MPKLVFHCVEPGVVPADIPLLLNELQNIGFMGERWQSPADVAGDRYLIGEHFLSMVTFMGCAPAIELEPLQEEPGSTEFCHFEIAPIETEVKFIRGNDHIVCRCPHCRQRHTDWQRIPQDLVYRCDKCGEVSHLSQYDWKNSAGCGRFFIFLHGIYPQEALPTSSLLQQFEKLTGQKWRYFYVQ